jgi:hypothetical protein
MEAINTYTTRIHKDDLLIFKGLAELLIRFPKMYRTENISKNWLLVHWKGSSLGEGAVRIKNDELLDPYKQAERLSKKGSILVC